MTDIDRIFPTRLNFPVAGATMKVEVDATHSGWYHSNASSWCPVKQYSNCVTVTASENTTKKLRSTSMAIISGDDMDDTEDISINQSCKFNAENLIMVQKQPTDIACAATCIAMCVCQEIEQFKKDGLSIGFISNWYAYAEQYGYTLKNYPERSLKKVYDLLKQGYPVISYINDGKNGKSEHCVVICHYTGTSENGENLNESDFLCADPWYGDIRKLNTAMNFNKITSTYVYEQNVC